MASSDNRHEHPGIKFMQLKYDKNNSQTSSSRLLYSLYPDWEDSPGPVDTKQFTEGVMNTLLKFKKEDPNRSDSENEKEAILLRAYGGSDILVDRNMEARTHTLLTEWGLAAPLLARFENGLLYKFTPGRACKPQDLAREPIRRAIATKLGEWHACLPVPKQDIDSERNVWGVLKQWVDALPTSKPEEAEKKDALGKELQKSIVELGEDNGKKNKEWVLGHCDLLAGNVIIPEHEATQEQLNHSINFIDYEFAMLCPAAFDLANHLSEWGGFECDYTLLPTRTQRQSFVEDYLKSYNTHTTTRKHVPLVEDLLAEVDRYRGLPGLYWGLHALIQAKDLHMDFDWPTYADLRLGEFWAWREELDGTRVGKGKKIPLRERKWAQEN